MTAVTGSDVVPGGTWPEAFEHKAGVITEDEAARVAIHHAAATWAEPAAVGPMLHVCDVDGDAFAYAVPFALGRTVFPPVPDVLELIARLHREQGMEPEGRRWATPDLVDRVMHEFGRFGTVYVSAQRTRVPVLMTTNTLPAFFFMADLAATSLRRVADRGGIPEEARVARLMFAGPHEELLECTAGERTLLLDADSMQLTDATAYTEASARAKSAQAEPESGEPEESAAAVEAMWESALAGYPALSSGGDGPRAAGDTLVTVPSPRRIPAVNWTYWCVPTAWTMALSYWDHQATGYGTNLGYGKVVDFWFDHDPTMNNVPNLIDEIIDKTLTPPTWAGDAIDIVNKQGYTFAKSAITCTAANGWGFAQIKAEIDAGRPVVVGMRSTSGPNHNGHAMVVYGYRVASTGQHFLLLLNTWGTTWDQQSTQLATGIWKNLPLITMTAERLIPGGGSGANHVVLTGPSGGQTLNAHVPYDITWYVWGTTISRSRLSESHDGGRTWQVISADVPTTAGTNSYRWVPQHPAARSRVRVECFTATGTLVAADGSRQNVVLRTQPLNTWGGWLGLGHPGIAVSDLSVARNADGRLELVAVTTDGAAWHRYQGSPNSQSWIGWGSMGHPPGTTWLRSAQLATNADGRLEVIALGSDGAVWHRWQPQPSKGPWAGWTSVGKPAGAALRRLVLERNLDGRLQVFAIGDDNALWTSSQTGPGAHAWSSWASLGGPGGGATLLHVDAVANTDGRIEVVLSGGVPSGSEFGLTDPRVWLVYQPAPNAAPPWSSWVNLGHPMGGAGLPVPVISRNADGRLEIFAPGLGGQLWHRWQPAAGQGPWGSWASLGHPGPGESLLSPLAVGHAADGRLQAFGVGLRSVPGGLVSEGRHIWQTKPSNGWSTWGSLGSPPARTVQQLSTVARQDGHLEVFALTAEDKAVWHNCQQ